MNKGKIMIVLVAVFVVAWAFDLASTTIAYNHFGPDYFSEHEINPDVRRMFEYGRPPLIHLGMNLFCIGLVVGAFKLFERAEGLHWVLYSLFYGIGITGLVVGMFVGVMHIPTGLSWWL